MKINKQYYQKNQKNIISDINDTIYGVVLAKLTPF